MSELNKKAASEADDKNKKKKSVFITLIIIAIIILLLLRFCGKGKGEVVEEAAPVTIEAPAPVIEPVVEPEPVIAAAPVPAPVPFTVTLPGKRGMVRDGYDFAGWKDNAGNFFAPGSTVAVDRDMAFSPVWVKSAVAKEEPVPEIIPEPVLAAAPVEEEPVETGVEEVEDWYNPARTLVAIKGGYENVYSIYGSLALLPNIFVSVSGGLSPLPDDICEDTVRTKLIDVDEGMIVNALVGLGYNYKIRSQKWAPDFYIESMLGPAWFIYENRTTDDTDCDTYLFWRTNLGVELPFTRHWAVMVEGSLDYMSNYGFDPRISLGLSYRWPWSVGKYSWDGKKDKMDNEEDKE